MSTTDVVPANAKKELTETGRRSSLLDPFDLFGSFRQEFDDMFARFRQDLDRSLPARFGNGKGWAPAVNVHETEKQLLVQAELPGMKLEDMTLQIQDGLLHIRGERREEQQSDTDGWHVVESSYGSFHRSIRLPDYVKIDNPKATLKDGILTIAMDKDQAKVKAKVQRIPISAG
jgi:HSP20 family protein